VKTASAVEAVAKLKVVAFDKTGTLTEGRNHTHPLHYRPRCVHNNLVTYGLPVI
jgi:P-type E1-E2 ATPase